MFNIFAFCESKGFKGIEEDPLRMVKEMPGDAGGYVLVDINCDVEDDCHISVAGKRIAHHTLFRGLIPDIEFAELLFKNLQFENFMW